MKVLFVCLGNICRSPTAEAVFTARAKQAGLAVKTESAGTAAWHVGSPPDPRSREAGEARGYSFDRLFAREVKQADFAAFDYILAMDRQNLQNLTLHCPEEYRSKLNLFLEFAPDIDKSEVPDPYYGGPNGFEHVVDLIEAASDGLINHIRAEHS